ncbi:class I SAM-dependent DNA methyltransferase [Phaeodactylibacter xiamenensis]|uniref:site-specific DNA-methyltransferase (adenine-specific) n=2 Tax=Phaeodactylibacter xiamenensis TaxID=1524460 RepID=A0A098S1U6_9BACT|nr:DNA methyltransferase [Phaeodactylibacter xiamenensis]KGE85127.1 lactate dehydrogenase [Phaeodactylibacter xiamenensis]
MNAVEIEEAVSELAEQPFDPAEFPFAFLEAYGNKETTVKRLRKGNSNKSKIEGGVLQRNNIHIATCEAGAVADTLRQLQEAPETAKNKAKFVLATDGEELQAENLNSGETLACAYPDFHQHFTFFFELAGISTVKEIRESSFDIKATGRLNKLYMELLRANPDWVTPERKQDMNHFMARLIFCFFAEDTSIFAGDNLFTGTVEQMSAPDASNMHEIIGELFRAMDVKAEEREAQGIRTWARKFPYVNGELFSGATDCPRFTKIARSYLLHVGRLDWQQINPDIFGSMIQAVADEDERGSLGMHYTSVPNILKVLNPLFLDELREQLEEAGDNPRKLLNLRRRIARIRVFDPACGSGNFLVIAYKQLREIEHEINRRRGEPDRPTEIPLTNFRGIEIKGFSAEIARLALIIAEYQCDVLYLGQQLALAEFLPLDAENWITCGNALRINWLTVCPPTGTGVKLYGDDLFSTPLQQANIDFEHEGGETFICGNPPYKGRNRQSALEKKDTAQVFSKYKGSFASLDYVANWMIKAAEFCTVTNSNAALVTTNSICQGEQVALLWSLVFNKGFEIYFAHTSFKWANLASHKAGVTVVIIGISKNKTKKRLLFTDDVSREVDVIGPYLVPCSSVIVSKRNKPLSLVGTMYLGNMAKDGGNLIMSRDNAEALIFKDKVSAKFIRPFYGSDELIKAKPRACLWIEDEFLNDALENDKVKEIISKVRDFRSASKAASTRKHAATPHRFVQLSASVGNKAIVIPRVSSENRHYLPVDYIDSNPVIGDKCYVMYDEPLWNLSLIASKLHIVWIGTVCSRLRTDYSYGNKLGWNTFPVPKLTTKNKEDLTRCAEDILLARERHFPATIADLYDPEKMPEDLRHAHERNDEVLERIYIGRRFKNDTERLEKLFELYTEMTAKKDRP